MPSALHAAQRATVTIPLVKSAPLLDGALNDRCWQQATEVGPFVLNSGKRLATEQTRGWLCYDDTALYIGFQCKESALEPRKQQSHLVKAEARGHDDPRTFRDDIVEVFVEPAGRPYYHFALNTVNARFEQRGLDPKWDGGWNAVAKAGLGEWTAEFVILFESLGVKQPPPGTQWRINLCRQEKPRSEISTWSGLVGPFHQPAQFGVAVFQPGAPIVGDVTTTMLPGGEYALTATLRNLYPTPRLLQLRGIAVSREGQKTAQAPVSLPGTPTPSAPAESKVALRLPLTELLGDVNVQFVLAEAMTGLVLNATPELPVFQASTRGQARLAGSGAVELFVNGESIPLPSEARAADFQLRLGVNVIGIRATSTDAAAWVEGKFRLETTYLITDGYWKATTAGAEGWSAAAFDDRKWPRAKPVGDGRVWAAEAAAREVFLRRTLVLSDPDEPAWPHANEVIFPRQSTQMLYPFVDVPPQLLHGALSFHLEVPKELSIIDTDALHGAVPTKIDESRSPRGEAMKRYTLRFEALPANGFEVSVRYGGINGDTLKTLSSLRLGGTFGWKRWSDQIIASDRAYSMQPSLVKLAAAMTGTLWFDDFEVRDAATGSVLWREDFEGARWTGNPFVVTERRDGKPTRCLKMEAAPTTPTPAGASEAAPGGALSQLLAATPIPLPPGARLIFSCTARGDNIVAPGPPTRLALVARLEETKWKESQVFTSFELDDGSVTQIPRAITVQAVPALAGVMPQKIRLMPCYYNDAFASNLMHEALVDNLVKSGLNFIYGRATNRVMKSAAAQGVKLIYALEWDPYTTSFDRKYLSAKPEARAVHANGTALSQTICPSYLLQPECDLVPRLNEFVAAKVKEQKPSEVNWDFEQSVSNPPLFCFDDRCLTKFAELAQLAEKPTRGQVLANRALLAQWTDFRCQQNSQTIALVKKAVQLADPLLPFSVYSGYQSQYGKEHYGVDWSLLTAFVDGAIAGYNGTEQLVTDTLAALGKVPLIGGQMWLETMSVNEPSRFDHAGWKRRLLRTIVDNGGKGALFWWLPTMSGGGFAQIAELTQFLAQYEDFIIANDRRDNLVQVEPTTFRARDAKVLVKGDERLVLLFNESREPLKVNIKNLNLPKDAQATVIGEPRSRAKAEEFAVTVPPSGFIAVHVTLARK